MNMKTPEQSPHARKVRAAATGRETDRASSAAGDRLGDSPRATAQRQQLDAAFGSSLDDRASNRTGMPDTLKAGVESLAGMDLSDVRVHRNSDKPAQLNALAYAQGNDIHLAPGQDAHLPHEAWHVVQQRQGRVRPTMQMQGVAVNDDAALEREADSMGDRARAGGLAAVQRRSFTSSGRWSAGYRVAQRTPEEEKVVKEEQNKEAFDKLTAALSADTSTAVVRIAVRAKSASNKTWKWQSVGHSSVQLSVYAVDQSLHVQIGLDNGGSVKIEGNLYKSADTDKYDIILLEKPIARGAALALVERMRQEVGASHTYAEWMTPSAESRGYENCTTWALKIGSEAGISVPTTLASSLGLVPDPASLAERIRGKEGIDTGGGEARIDLKHNDPPHIIGRGGQPDVILGDTTSDKDAGKWAAVRAILEAQARGEAVPSADDLVYCYTAYPADQQDAAHQEAVRLAAVVTNKARERSESQKPKSGGVGGTVAVVGVGVVIAGVAVYLFSKRQNTA
jgi:hypothetical protein